jgi:hypothetical protein
MGTIVFIIADILHMGDIEKFFNENFFKKVKSGEKSRSYFFQGSAFY